MFKWLKTRILFYRLLKSKNKDFDLNLLNKDVRSFVKQINLNPKINLRVFEMPNLLLKKGWDGYVINAIDKYNGDVKSFIFLRTTLTKKELLKYFWHEVGHLLFKIHIDGKLKKRLNDDLKFFKDKLSQEEFQQIANKYTIKCGEEIVCEMFALGILNKEYCPWRKIKGMNNIIKVYNILMIKFVTIMK